MAIRGQFANAFSGRDGALFITEILLGAIVPLALLARKEMRTQQSLLALGAALTTAGIVFNRVNVVLFAMHLKGSMPQVSPEIYRPSIVEWGISIGLIAATIFLFGLGARLMPVLPKDEAHAKA